jgi:hypothetical protein
MKTLAIIALLGLASCDQFSEPHPGRFQMASVGDGTFVVLDTIKGTVALCAAGAGTVTCGPVVQANY